MNNTIRFCCGPIKPEHLTTDADRAVYQRHMFVYAAMGDMAWSLVELLNQCQYHEQYGSRAHLYKALVELQEIGMVRTEEAVFLDAAVARMKRVVDGTFTFQDIKARAGELAMQHGGAASRWVVSLFAYAARDLMRGVVNVLEMPLVFRNNDEQDSNERFVVTVRRQNGKAPMEMRRELLTKLAAMADAGGATTEQLRALVDAETNYEPTPGLAVLPNQDEHEREHPHVQYHGDRLFCANCLRESPMPFPATAEVLNAAIDAFIEVHQRCLPNNASAGELLRALREEKRNT